MKTTYMLRISTLALAIAASSLAVPPALTEAGPALVERAAQTVADSPETIRAACALSLADFPTDCPFPEAPPRRLRRLAPRNADIALSCAA
ncbi:hypothetical protein ACSQ76_16410 [Roseovarius sp. B08]|uniref:hypothetical protein n=1 Tax=Roseovarius sp. B08 TaxID=3449223 RepID=UPI003EDCA784